MQRVVEGAVIDFHLPVRASLEPLHDAESVLRSPGQRLQHQEVQRSLEQWQRRVAHESLP